MNNAFWIYVSKLTESKIKIFQELNSTAKRDKEGTISQLDIKSSNPNELAIGKQ